MKLVALVAVMALVGSGCAMTFQDHGPGRCSSSRLLPRLDVAALGIDAAGAIAGDALRTGSGFRAHTTIGPILLGVSMAAMAANAVSAEHGFRWADGCRGERTTATATR